MPSQAVELLGMVRSVRRASDLVLTSQRRREVSLHLLVLPCCRPNFMDGGDDGIWSLKGNHLTTI